MRRGAENATTLLAGAAGGLCAVPSTNSVWEDANE